MLSPDYSIMAWDGKKFYWYAGGLWSMVADDAATYSTYDKALKETKNIDHSQYQHLYIVAFTRVK